VPKSELIFGIVNDSHSERGVHWTLRLIHVRVDARGLGAAVETSASASTRCVHVDQASRDERKLAGRHASGVVGWDCCIVFIMAIQYHHDGTVTDNLKGGRSLAVFK
jgi:hypothetical protein